METVALRILARLLAVDSGFVSSGFFLSSWCWGRVVLMVRVCDGCWCNWGFLREEGDILRDVVVSRSFVPRVRSPRVDLLQLRQAIGFVLGWLFGGTGVGGGAFGGVQGPFGWRAG